MSKKFEEPTALSSVGEFHDLFDLPITEKAAIPSKERCQLRISLLEEELKELKEAIEDNDLIEVADAFADIQYVLSGAILEFGLADKFKHLFDEVHRSNMSKACNTMDVALNTAEKYLNEKGTESEIRPKGEKYLVYRIPDGKVLKSVEYSPAGISEML